MNDSTPIFINLSNHPSSGWSEEQLSAARAYGEIVDMPFPLVSPEATLEQVKGLGEQCVKDIMGLNGQKCVVHVMGEMTLTYRIVSLLKRRSIPCVASTTERQVYTDENGNKVSTFRFVQFREYTRVRLWRQWCKDSLQRIRNTSLSTLLGNKYAISLAVLLLLIATELFTLLGIRVQDWWPWGKIAVILGILIVFLWALSGVFNNDFRFNNVTLRRLLANAISPTWLGVAYLLSFVLHIGWTSNAVNSLFVDTSDGPQVFTSFGISLVGILVLILFFPEGKVDKSGARKAVFVSGISMISANKDRTDESKRVIPIRTIAPLVSALDLVFKNSLIKQENVSEFLILDTDVHHRDGEKNRVSLWDLLQENNWENCYVDTTDVEENPRQIKLQWMPSSDGRAAVESLITWLIKLTAKLKYPGHDAFIDGLTIRFMDKPCDYNHFDQCFEEVERAVRRVDNHEHLLYFNLTPGTGIVGSLMTLFAIDDNRRLYYYPQNSSHPIITMADKGKVPLENLLSQALENMRNS